MALNFGSIFGSLTVDTTGWTRKLDAAFKAGDQRLQQSTKRYGTEGAKAGEGFAGGVEAHTKGIGQQLAAIVDRVPAAYGREGTQAGAGFADGVEGKTAGLRAALAGAVDGVRERFTREGAQSGDGFADGVARTVDGRDMFRGVDGPLQQTRGQFLAAGRRAGDGFASGVGQGTEGVGAQLGSKLDTWGRGLLAGAAASIGALIGGLIAKGIMSSFEAERVAAKLTTELGLAGPRAAEIGRLVGTIYSENFGQSLEQVGDAVEAVFRNGLIPADASVADAKRVATSLLQIANVLDQDLSMAAEAAGAIMRNGLAPDVDTAMDIVAQAITSGGDKAGDLAETFQEYSPIFDQLGLDAAEASGVILQMLDAGARDADVAADALKELAIRSKEAVYEEKVVADTSVEASRRVADARRRVADAAQQGADRIVAADERIADMQRNAMRAQQALTDARAAAQRQLEQLAEDSEDAALSEESAALAVERARERLAEVNADPAASALDRKEADLAYRQAVDALDDQRKRVAELAATKADADARGVDGSKQVVDAFFGVIDANEQVGDAYTQRGRVQVENDRAATDAAEGLRDAQVELSKSYGGTIRTLTPLGQAYENMGLDAEAMQAAFAKGGDDARFAFELVTDRLRGMEDPILRNQTAIALFGTKAEDLQGALFAIDGSTAVATLGDTAGAVEGLSDAADNNLDKFEGWQRRLFGPDGFFSAENWNRGVERIFGPDGPLSPQKWDAGVETIRNAGTRMGIFITTKWEEIKTWVGEKVDGLVRIVSTAWDTMIETVRGLPGRVGVAAAGLWDSISGGVAIVKQWISDRWDEMVDAVTGLPDRIADAASGMWDGIKQAFKDALNWIIDKWNGLSFTIPGIDIPGLGSIGETTFEVPQIPRFHTGTGPGGVPGPLGQERLALVQSGERIYTAQQARALDRTMASMGGQASAGLDGIRTRPSFTHTSGPIRYPMGGDGPTVVHVGVTFAGPVAGRDGERWVQEQIASGVRKGIIASSQTSNGRTVIVR